MIYKPFERLRRAITLAGKHVIHSAGTMLIKPFLGKGAAVPKSGGTAVPRILYVNMAFRGDLILSFPALTAIRSRFPRAEITCWVRAYNVSLAKLCQAVDEVITYDRFHSSGLLLLLELLRLRRHRSFLEDIRSRRFDIMIDDSGFGFSALVGFLTGIPLRIGRNTQGYGFFYHHQFANSEEEQLVEKRLHLLKPLGMEIPQRHDYGLAAIGDRVSRSRSCMGLNPDERYFTVQTISGWDAKDWQDDKVVAVVDGFARETGLTPVFIGGPADQGRIDKMRERLNRRCLSSAGRLDLADACVLISAAQMHFGVDSVGSHMAAAVGVKSVTLFGPTNPLLSAFLSQKNIVALHPIQCSPESSKQYCALDGGRLCPKYLCMEGLEAEAVLGVIVDHWQGKVSDPVVKLR